MNTSTAQSSTATPSNSNGEQDSPPEVEPEVEPEAPTPTPAGELVQSVASKLIFDVINRKKQTPYDFYQLLLHLQRKANLEDIHSNPDSLNPLHAIIVNNRLNLIPVLIHMKLFSAYLCEPIPETSSSTHCGKTPIQVAESKCGKFMEVLVKHECLVDSMSKFLTACHNEDLRSARHMVRSQKSVVYEKDSFHNNCLYWALVSNNLEQFTFLLEKGADFMNVNSSKENLLHVACMFGHDTFIPILMARCKLPITAACCNGITPLEIVAKNGDVESLKQLLQQGVILTACVLPDAAAYDRLPFIRYAIY